MKEFTREQIGENKRFLWFREHRSGMMDWDEKKGAGG
jgi:hypothetical protein